MQLCQQVSHLTKLAVRGKSRRRMFEHIRIHQLYGNKNYKLQLTWLVTECYVITIIRYKITNITHEHLLKSGINITV